MAGAVADLLDMRLSHRRSQPRARCHPVGTPRTILAILDHGWLVRLRPHLLNLLLRVAVWRGYLDVEELPSIAGKVAIRVARCQV